MLVFPSSQNYYSIRSGNYLHLIYFNIIPSVLSYFYSFQDVIELLSAHQNPKAFSGLPHFHSFISCGLS